MWIHEKEKQVNFEWWDKGMKDVFLCLFFLTVEKARKEIKQYSIELLYFLAYSYSFWNDSSLMFCHMHVFEFAQIKSGTHWFSASISQPLRNLIGVLPCHQSPRTGIESQKAPVKHRVRVWETESECVFTCCIRCIPTWLCVGVCINMSVCVHHAVCFVLHLWELMQVVIFMWACVLCACVCVHVCMCV